MKKIQITGVLLFFAVLIGFGTWLVLLRDIEFSETENRYLAQKPAFSVQTILSGDFQKGLSDYLSDQIPLRNFWMQWNTQIKKALGKKEINGVYLGEDSYYFEKFTDSSYSLSRLQSVFSAMDTMAETEGIPCSVLLVPTPGIVLSEKLPRGAELYDPDIIHAEAKRLLKHCDWIDIKKPLAASEEQVFYRTDHHWTNSGAYLAYREFCFANDLAPRAYADFDPQTVSENFLGTLHSKIIDPAAVPDSIAAPQNLPKVNILFEDGSSSDSPYFPEKLQTKDQYAYFFGGNQGRIQIETENHNGKRILIFKDSFANSFVPYLFSEYETICMIDLRYYSGNIRELFSENSFDEVLFLYETSNFVTDTGILKLARKYLP